MTKIFNSFGFWIYLNFNDRHTANNSFPELVNILILPPCLRFNQLVDLLTTWLLLGIKFIPFNAFQANKPFSVWPVGIIWNLFQTPLFSIIVELIKHFECRVTESCCVIQTFFTRHFLSPLSYPVVISTFSIRK